MASFSKLNWHKNLILNFEYFQLNAKEKFCRESCKCSKYFYNDSTNLHGNFTA